MRHAVKHTAAASYAVNNARLGCSAAAATTTICSFHTAASPLPALTSPFSRLAPHASASFSSSLSHCTRLSLSSSLTTTFRRLPHATTSTPLHGTTILAVRKGGDVVMIGDGQVSMGGTVFKNNARKVRCMAGGKVIVGFAGTTADCFALVDIFEKKLEEYPGQLLRAGVELAKMWRTDKFLRHLEALLIAVDKDVSITLSGNGDVISEPPDGVIGIGSGGLYALSAARALVDREDLNARQVAFKAMRIAADICVYTNSNFTVEAFENGQLVTGEKKAERDAADRAYMEQADKEDRIKVEKSKLPATPIPNQTTTDKEENKK